MRYSILFLLFWGTSLCAEQVYRPPLKFNVNKYRRLAPTKVVKGHIDGEVKRAIASKQKKRVKKSGKPRFWKAKELSLPIDSD